MPNGNLHRPNGTALAFRAFSHHMCVLIFFFLLDAIREVRKYSARDAGTAAKMQPNMYDHLHMKLFRAQRNLYISGFAVFLWL